MFCSQTEFEEVFSHHRNLKLFWKDLEMAPFASDFFKFSNIQGRGHPSLTYPCIYHCRPNVKERAMRLNGPVLFINWLFETCNINKAYVILCYVWDMWIVSLCRVNVKTLMKNYESEQFLKLISTSYFGVNYIKKYTVSGEVKCPCRWVDGNVHRPPFSYPL